MLFRRRNPPTRLSRFRELIWPRMSFRRVLGYYKSRMARLPGTPHSIAAGFAAGAAVSFTPFMGFHFLLGALVAWALRGNLIASALGTLVGNPWTFPFIWVAIYKVGAAIMLDSESRVPLNDLSLTYLWNHIGDVLLPMMLGGAILSVIVWPLFYFPLARGIERFRKMRFERRLRKRSKEMAVPGQAVGQDPA